MEQSDFTWDLLLGPMGLPMGLLVGLPMGGDNVHGTSRGKSYRGKFIIPREVPWAFPGPSYEPSLGLHMGGGKWEIPWKMKRPMVHTPHGKPDEKLDASPCDVPWGVL